MRKYSTAPGSRSSLVFSSSSIGAASVKHRTVMMRPASVHKISDVWTQFLVSSSCRAPRYCATRTLTPLDRPIRKPVKSVTSVDVEPTEPSAVALENFPTTATSAILNGTCSSCENISGTLNRKIFRSSDPSVIEMPAGRAERVFVIA